MLIFVIHQLLSFICFGIAKAFAFHAKKATENEKQREREDSGVVGVTTWLTN